jgi:predicted lipoprotein with Yx(FWY)xxD motif
MFLQNRLRFAASFALLAASFAASAAYASPGVGTTSSPDSGSILTDDHGMTLYRYTADQPNVSTCYASCARAWPPVIIDDAPQAVDPSLSVGLGVAPRTDGSQQLTYRGAPLYYYVGDTQPGDVTGQASDGVWFVVNAP